MPLVAAADAEAFRAILDRHGDAAFALAYRMCGSRTLAEEVTQEAFLAVWRSAGRYDPARGSVRGWTLAVVHHRAVDTLRSKGRQPSLLRERDGGHERPELEAPERTEGQAIARVEGESLRRALLELPAEQRQALELAYFGGFSQSEIAAMLDEPLGTIKGRMRLALDKLRDGRWEAAV